MAIPKVVGLETEYGIGGVGIRDFNPVLASSFLIGGYAGDLRRIRWDFEDESPMRDARDANALAVRGPIEDDIGLANVILPNGSRFYVDHAHPEYSTPECRSALDVVAHGRAGDRILEEALDAFADTLPPGERVVIHKNNSDGKGNSYGAHENYLVDRRVPFDDLVGHLLAFLVTRQVFTGAGKLAVEAPWTGDGPPGFQITQRADFFEAEVGLETTLRRPIVNTRDEPHASRDRYRRLHVIVGDANLCDVAGLLKVGTTMLVLRMIEDGAAPRFDLADAVHALRRVSHDPTCRARLELADGRSVTALEIQTGFLDAASRYLDREGATDEDRLILRHWERVVGGLADEPRDLAADLDWVAKLVLLEAYRDRDGLPWTDARLRAMDLQYHDVSRGRGLYHRLEAAGRITRLVDDAAVEAAMVRPPEDTRAWFRGACVERFRPQVAAASWDSVTFDVGAGALRRLPMADPLKGTREGVGALVEASEDAADLLARLAGDRGVRGPR